MRGHVLSSQRDDKGELGEPDVAAPAAGIIELRSVILTNEGMTFADSTLTSGLRLAP
jgi:hypothetical protein